VVAKLIAWWNALSPAELMWLTVGLIGQVMFSARWLIQWFATEKSRRSTMPETFWYLSLLGGLLVFAYGLHRLDPVIILGQFGVLIYARNLFFIRKEKKEEITPPSSTAAPAGS
jgi:lipid-A-disaccharide synthase-like uncharacterized protein